MDLSPSFQGTAAIAAIAGAVVFGAIATYTDLKERRVPNAVTGAFAAIGLGLALFTGSLSSGFVLAVAIAFAFSYAAYRVGAWAGGDAKLFTVMACFYAIAVGPSPTGFAVLFLNSVIALLPVAAILYGGRIRGAGVDWKAALGRAAKAGGIGALVAGVISAAGSYVSVNAIATGFVVAFAFAFLAGVFPAVARAALRRVKKVSELKEGDIPAVTVIEVSGRAVLWSTPSVSSAFRSAFAGKKTQFSPPGGKIVADGRRAAGLTGTEITKLKALGVKGLEVRESVAFAPAVALGFLLSLWLRWAF